MSDLTTKQMEYYDFIKKYIDTYGYSPSIRDIGKVFERSTGSVYPMLKILREKGYITFEEKKSRTIKIIK